MEWRKKSLAGVLLSLMAASVARAGGSLEGRIQALLGSDLVKGASISLDVVEVTPKGPVELYGYHATTPLGPASNCKLLTTSAAFEKYGAKAAFKTMLYKVGDDLLIVGGGDPGLGDSKLAAANGETVTKPFEDWAATLKNAGITSYRDLIVDDRVFDSQWVHPNWPADQRLDWYSAPVGGLNFNANCLDWLPTLTGKGVTVELIPHTTYVSVVNKASRGPRTLVSLIRPADSNKFELRGTISATATTPLSVPIYDPGLWTGTILRDVLANQGITATGNVRRIEDGEQLTGATLLASHATPILSVIKRADTDSLNMMAESLCKRLGHDATGQPGSWTNGPAAVKTYLANLGIQDDWATLDDGSGLSNKNKVAAKVFTTVLAHVAATPDADAFVNCLATPGEDGTLRNRFKAKPCADAIHAKTGHITGVSTLSGFIDVPSAGGKPRRIVFSILCNKYKGNVNPWQDDVCEAIYDWASGK